jgi:P4 family phage/plasmid primase-like protien
VRVSDTEIQDLRSRADIVAIIGRDVPLKREGREWVGCCPFHADSTPSLKVDGAKKAFICFGCDAKGDVIEFVRRLEALDFPKAVARVRELAGVRDEPLPGPRPVARRTMAASPAASGPAPAAKVGPIVAVYPYTDERGTTLFEVCRHEPGENGSRKTFRQRVPTPQGYSYSVKGIRRVLYRLPQVLAASEVWICEGEKDVHTLEAQGAVATTNAGGAKQPWLAEYTAALAGRTVFIVPDNDEPGMERGRTIAAALAAVATVTVVQLPSIAKDVTDYIAAGNSLHDLRLLAMEVPAAAPDTAHYGPKDAGEKLEPNDIARLIIRDHSIIADQKGYVYHYNGRYWDCVTPARIAALAMTYDTHNATQRRRRMEAVDYVMTFCHVREVKWRQVPLFEVPVWNGVVNLKTMAIRPHRKEDYLESVPPVPLTASGECPAWMEALFLYWGQDADYAAKVAALQEFFGYCLMTHARYKKALMLVGESNCGKSQVPQVLRILLGDANICAVPVEFMDDARKLAPLIGKSCNMLTELTSKSMVADGGFKTLVSTEEPVLIDPKWGQPILYAPIAKHVIACNSLPRVSDLSRGFFSRLLLLKFNRVIPEGQRDRGIVDRFRAEREGILAWALEGAARLFRNGGDFTDVPESEAEIDRYRTESNPVNAFVAECCGEVDEEDTSPLLLSAFTEKFSKWVGKHQDSRAVATMLRSAGHKVEKSKRGPYRDKLCVFGLDWQ